jgi:mannose-6-phosphate isomerase-like protein (cupin superfamily)
VNHSRRELAALLPMLAAMAKAQQPAGKKRGPSGPLPVLQSKVYDVMPKSIDTDIMKEHTFFHGVTTRGQAVELKFRELAPGHPPHPPHKHVTEEIIMLVEGTMEVELNGTDGQFGTGERTTIGPGGVIFDASNVVHGMRNTGDTWAKYWAISLGDHTA